VLSVVTVMADGRTVESDTVGYESAVGVLCALGASASVSRTFTQIGGSTIRLSASRLRHRAEESASLRRLLIRYAQANLAQAHQSVACNALHDLTQRLCRWLLMSHDRTGGDEVRLTQQYLATMLGVQRTTVTEALRELASAGLIRQQRGAIHVLDRADGGRDLRMLRRRAVEPAAAYRRRSLDRDSDSERTGAAASGERLGHGRIDQGPKVASQGQPRVGAHHLGHEHHRQVLLRVDPEGGGGRAAPEVLAQ